MLFFLYFFKQNDVNKETAQDVETAQVPIANDVPSEPTQANELNESREQQTHNPPQTKQITQHTEVKLNDQHKSSACESNSELPARQKTRSTGVRIKVNHLKIFHEFLKMLLITFDCFFLHRVAQFAAWFFRIM